MNEYILVGKTRKTHGVKGGVKLDLEEEFIEDVLKIDVAFLKIQGKFLPYFVDDFEYTNSLIVYFEDINSPEQANPVTSKEFFVRAKDIQKKETITHRVGGMTYGKLVDYSIEHETEGAIGKILDIHEFPQQEMAEVSYQEKEIFIPLNQQFILSVDDQKKIVKMSFPEGLLNL